MAQKVGAAAVARVDLDDSAEQVKRGQPPTLAPVGQCPYCHHDLEQRKVTQQPDIHSMRLGPSPVPVTVLLTFWACMNEGCSLMFWRHPRQETTQH